MDDVQLQLAHQRISKYVGMPFCCLDADKNFTVLKRQHVSRTRLPKKLPMQKRHSPVRDQPDENLWQFAQIRLFPLSHVQTMAHSFRGELLKPVKLDWNSSLKIPHADFGTHFSHLAI